MHTVQHSMACQLPAATTTISIAHTGCHCLRRRLLDRAQGRAFGTRGTRTKKENPLHTLKLLPRRHSETTSTPHSYPSVTSRTPQGGSDTETPSTHDATMRRKARGQRKGKKKQPRLSAHINPWRINSSQRRKQSQNTPTVASSFTPTASSAGTVKLPP